MTPYDVTIGRSLINLLPDIDNLPATEVLGFIRADIWGKNARPLINVMLWLYKHKEELLQLAEIKYAKH